MPRSCGLIFSIILLAASLFGADPNDQSALWSEYGLVNTQAVHHGRVVATAYKMKDPTGAFAAWQWLRSAKSHSCNLASFCTQEGNRTVIYDGNYVLSFLGPTPTKADVTAILNDLKDHREADLPPVLVFVPKKNLIPGSARYLLGPASVDAFAPDLKGLNLGFNLGTEGEVASYKSGSGKPVRLVILDYPTPDMARHYQPVVTKALGQFVKRSGVLVAAVLPPAPNEVADSLLSQVRYEAKIVWNDEPPKDNPVKRMYELLVNIVYLSCILVALCLAAGIFYAGMRVYRRRYGNLESEEAMTTLHLSGD